MKIVRFNVSGGTEARYGFLENGIVIEIETPGGDWPEPLNIAIAGRSYPLTELQLLAPCEPTKILCSGMNYRRHAAEMNLPVSETPVLFMKPPTTVIGPEEVIRLPAASDRVDYEAELGVVIGRQARHVAAAVALDFVLGYTCANDVTARDLQPKNGQWTYAKSFDTFCPLGPVIETDIANPEELMLTGHLNGILRQSASTAEHIFGVAELIAYISACMTLLPGDVILTGTPSGIGPLKPGDRYAVAIDGIGRIENYCLIE